eukprot:TRINITY_DN290_c0_g1_i1.p1 TRINITY_DN290_c0_g1~~TRINITY_DN290_c0_g1_i1.p1  ORF type:complete len:467 (+),score=176.23 TRINITY_DN290_c0_g1_i1:149-1549(+)
MAFGYFFGKKEEDNNNAHNQIISPLSPAISEDSSNVDPIQPQFINFSTLNISEPKPLEESKECHDGTCKRPNRGGLPSQGSTKSGRPYRILSLDGGGARGILQIAILQRIAHAYPPFLDQIDLFSGTSAGSINAAALAVGKTPDDLMNVWLKECKGVFTESLWKRMKSGNNLFGASYDAEPIRKMAKDIIGDKTLRDVRKGILIPAFNLDPDDDESSNIPHNLTMRPNVISGLKAPHSNVVGGAASTPGPFTPSLKPRDRRWFPEYFHNFKNSSNADTLLSDACLRSAAAPTYFPIYQGFVDGGVFANNPSLAAITSCICEGIDIRDICVLSVSTGNNPVYIGKEKYGDGNWGVYEWGLQLIDLLMDSTSAASTHQSACLLGEQFYRVDPCLSDDIKLDDASEGTVKHMLDVASRVDLEPIIDWLKKFWEVKPEDKPSSTMAFDLETKSLPSTLAPSSLEKEWLML